MKVVKSVKVIKKKQNKWMELINNLLKNDWWESEIGFYECIGIKIRRVSKNPIFTML